MAKCRCASSLEAPIWLIQREVGMTEKMRDIYVSGGIVLGSIFFLTWVIPTFTPPYPGYGVSSALLPNIVFGLILGLSILSMSISIVSYWRKKSQHICHSITEKNKVHLRHLCIFMTPCILLMPAMQWIGFIPAGLTFLVIMQYLCGQRNVLKNIIVSICTVGSIYAAMEYGLGVPMP